MAKIISKKVEVVLKTDDGVSYTRTYLIHENEIIWSRNSNVAYKLCLWHENPIWYSRDYNTANYKKMDGEPECETSYQKLLRSDKLERILKDD